jgi:hypothetical protein
VTEIWLKSEQNRTITCADAKAVKQGAIKKLKVWMGATVRRVSNLLPTDFNA